MTKIKICGLQSAQDINYVNTLKPDYVGFVFADSKRHVDENTAAILKQRLEHQIKAVGVFVYEDVDKVAEIANKDIIDLIQLHGDETPEYCSRLKAKTDKPIIKVIRVRDRNSVACLDGFHCDYFLLDTFKVGKFGGVGQTFDYKFLADTVIPKPFFMAGGLTADNVGRVLGTIGPYGVDVSSGVETKGYKDFAKMAQFIQTVQGQKAK